MEISFRDRLVAGLSLKKHSFSYEPVLNSAQRTVDEANERKSVLSGRDGDGLGS